MVTQLSERLKHQRRDKAHFSQGVPRVLLRRRVRGLIICLRGERRTRVCDAWMPLSVARRFAGG